ncbi:hypothetical protein GGE68_002054 [Rhizobium leguminosarum]|nr:hypothetical protein [Rhizobium leguminosarum]
MKLVAASMRQRKRSIALTDARQFAREIGQAVGDQMNYVTLALDAAIP